MKIISLADYRSRMKTNPLTTNEQTDLIEKLLVATEDLNREVLELRRVINTLLRGLRKTAVEEKRGSSEDN